MSDMHRRESDAVRERELADQTKRAKANAAEWIKRGLVAYGDGELDKAWNLLKQAELELAHTNVDVLTIEGCRDLMGKLSEKPTPHTILAPGRHNRGWPKGSVESAFEEWSKTI
jgi:hypothetical protein